MAQNALPPGPTLQSLTQPLGPNRAAQPIANDYYIPRASIHDQCGDPDDVELGDGGSWKIRAPRGALEEWYNTVWKKDVGDWGFIAEMQYGNFVFVGTFMGFDVACGRSTKVEPRSGHHHLGLFLYPTTKRGDALENVGVWRTFRGPAFTGFDQLVQWHSFTPLETVQQRIPAIANGTKKWADIREDPNRALLVWQATQALMQEKEALAATFPDGSKGCYFDEPGAGDKMRRLLQATPRR